MKINSTSKKFLLAFLIAYGGVLWLNVWHRIGHSYGMMGSEPMLSWLRDSVIVLLPVLLAVLIGTAAAQWLGRLSNGRMPPLAQTSLSVVFVDRKSVV